MMLFSPNSTKLEYKVLLASLIVIASSPYIVKLLTTVFRLAFILSVFTIVLPLLPPRSPSGTVLGFVAVPIGTARGSRPDFRRCFFCCSRLSSCYLVESRLTPVECSLICRDAALTVVGVLGTGCLACSLFPCSTRRSHPSSL
jgi:hypothetical protein